MSFAQWATRKRLSILAIIAVAMAIAVVVLVVVLRDDKPANSTDDAIKNADAATAEGDYEVAFNMLKQTQAKATTNDEKIKVLNDLAAAAANAGQVDAAIDYYAQKHLIDPNTLPADGLLVGELYERQEKTQKAIEYYQKYLEYLQGQSANEFHDAEIASVTERIRQLEEGQ